MEWFCGTDSRPEVNPPQIFNEFTRISHHDDFIQREYVPHDPKRNYEQFRDWKRVKFRSQHFGEIYAACKKSFTNFIDQDFPHVNESISSMKEPESIEWMRVADIVPNAVFSKEYNHKIFDKFKSNNRELQNAMILIGRAHPEVFKQILAKSLNDEGVQQFRLFHNGVIQSVVIDDYLPAYKNVPLFTGPARENEVFPMLLEKALAKVCGNYENIPQETQTIMEMIFCGAVRKTQISKVANKAQIIRSIQTGLENKGLTIVQSKYDPKIRNHGINESELYQIINSYEVTIDKKPLKIFEMLSQTKLSAWNGNFCITDQVWKAVEQDAKNKIFSSIKKNKSFCMGENDIPKIFEELLVFEDSDINNKDWLESISENDYPAFARFAVQQEEGRVFIRVTAAKKIRQTVIFARVRAKNDYEFIDSAFTIDGNVVEVKNRLGPGEYVVCIYHNWTFDNSGDFSVFLSSSKHIYLEKGNRNDYPNFLEQICEGLAEKMNSDSKKLYSITILVKEMGLALLHIKAQHCKSPILRVQIDQKKLQNSDWELLPPYNTVKQLQLKRDGDDRDKLLILKCNDYRDNLKVHFPTTAFFIKE